MTKPERVEIWRYNDSTVTVAHSDGGAWNCTDVWLTALHHNGVWSSLYMQFLPKSLTDTFSDGTPVSLYEGLDTVEDT